MLSVLTAHCVYERLTHASLILAPILNPHECLLLDKLCESADPLISSMPSRRGHCGIACQWRTEACCRQAVHATLRAPLCRCQCAVLRSGESRVSALPSRSLLAAVSQDRCQPQQALSTPSPGRIAQASAEKSRSV